MSTYSDASAVEVALDKERVKAMSQEEKLNVLVDIAFANHQTIKKVGKVLSGDGKEEGLLDTVRDTKKAVTWLWGMFCGAGGAFFSAFIYHIMK
ncbi:MAG: hypothetical protein IMZ53_04290 [Thermoplasmata archaeon]|nr:hypothetical protein [Thermoplasmata archaeon]